MQLNWPMPFADTGFAAPNNFTNTAGIYSYTSGTATTTLTGKYVNISDTCGNISNSSSNGNINLGGLPGQHDCTGGGGSPGNTSSSRTAFYEVNRIAEMARGYLPGKCLAERADHRERQPQPDLQCLLRRHRSISSSRGWLPEHGEIAAVFDHEWGHGLDDHDTGGASATRARRTPTSRRCTAWRRRASATASQWTANEGCGMTADGTGFNNERAQTGPQHCDTDCSGVREQDWAKHTPNTPDTALGFVCTQCFNGGGPCNREEHCSAAPSAQAAWDLVARDLTAAPFNMNSQTAFITGNRLFYLGSGNIGLWHSCTCGVSSDGCGAASGYMQWLGADDTTAP
jgi:hypothetical protein